jgi:glycerophosphoryl diester phosphodiesterase
MSISQSNQSNPLIIAHRGASGEAPENTLAAFQLALEQGCDAIELDIHLSADGELIVCHDDFINRTTNGTGKISEMSASQLKQYDAGLWFHEKYKGESLPLLEEVFELVPSNIIVNVEIKNVPSYYEGIEQKLINLLTAKNRLANVVVSSFDHQCLVRLKEIEPEAKIGILYYSKLVHHRKYTSLFPAPVYSLHPNFEVVTSEEIEDAKEHGLQVYSWTVNQPQEMIRVIDSGVSGVITDYPLRMKSLLQERSKR